MRKEVFEMITWSSSSAVFSILFMLIYVGALGLGIYCVVLFIKFTKRAIKALDIYLEEKRRL